MLQCENSCRDVGMRFILPTCLPKLNFAVGGLGACLMLMCVVSKQRHFIACCDVSRAVIRCNF